MRVSRHTSLLYCRPLTRDPAGRTRRASRKKREAERTRLFAAEKPGFDAQHAKYLAAVKLVSDLSQYACWDCFKDSLVLESQAGFSRADLEELGEDKVLCCRDCDTVCCERCMEDGRRCEKCYNERMVDRGRELECY